MTKISEANVNSIFALHDKIEQSVKGCKSLDLAAQKFNDVLFDAFEESIVLTRLFATVPYGKLPPANKKFVDALAESTGITSLLREEMLVISLLGTRGEKRTWNSRYDSEGHVGIPLASADFVEAIPMVSRLLNELGLGLDWIDSHDSDIIARIIGKMAGVFYVPDAKTTTDHKGRQVIAAQNFVDEHKVKTVFGLGGAYLYLGSKTFLANIIFTREQIEKRQAERYMTLLNTFKTTTVALDASGQIFS
jgi:hypothetical protein